MSIKKIVLIVIGCISLVLGCIGAVVVLLPSVPFLMITLYCFARSSERLHNWFKSTSIYKKHLADLVNDRAMTVKSKVCVMLTVTALMALGFYMMDKVPVGRIVLAVIWLLHMFYFLFAVKNKKAACEN